jgi:hypothetical protein
VKFTQPSFGAGELSPALWSRVDFAKFHVGAKVLKNMIVLAEGGVTNRAGTAFTGELEGDGRLIPFEFNTDQTYMLVFTDHNMRIVRDGGFVLTPGPLTVVEVASPYALADLPLVRFAQSADTLFLTHPSYPSYSLTRTDHHLWAFTALNFGTTATSPSNVQVTGNVNTYILYDYTVRAVNGNAGQESAIAAALVISVFDGQVTLTWDPVGGATSYDVYRNGVFRQNVPTEQYLDSGGAAVGAAAAIDNVLAAAANITAVFVPSLTSRREHQYAVSSVVGNDESLPSTAVTSTTSNPWGAGEKLVISWNAVANATEYNVYKNTRGQWGWIGTVNANDPLQFTDDNIDPDVSFGVRGNAIYDFSAADQYPAAVALYQQRLAFARSNERPTTVWASRTGSLLDFTISDPLRADDPVEAIPASGKVNGIRHLVPLDGLLLFTAGSEIVLRGSNGALAANNLEFTFQSYIGCAEYPAPLSVNKSVLFAQRDGKKIHDYSFKFEVDGYSGTDLNALANHVFSESKVVSWAYQQSPFGVIWCVREDGSLGGMTYKREHDVYAWHRHETDGQFRSVGSITGAVEDDVYFIVRRTVDSQTVYYVEKMAQRVADGGVFLDCSLSYSGAPATNISGLGHLEGETVNALADGNVVRDLVVSGGAVTLPNAASEVHVGLPYTSEIQTLDLDMPQGDNQGKRQKISRVALRLLESSGGQTGPDVDHLYDIAYRSFENYNQPTALFTGDKDLALSAAWGRTCKLVVRQTSPLPLTVLAVIPDVEVGS